jgi:hypothetical protein
VTEKRRYISVVIHILKDEGLYKPNMPEHMFIEINKRISDNHSKGLTIRKCADDVAKEIQHAKT